MSKQTFKTVSAAMSKHQLKLPKFTARSHNQEAFWNEARDDEERSHILWGSAGSGKSFLALRSAFDDCVHGKNDYRRIVLVRSAVASRDIGFLPGTLEEKSAVYEAAYQGIIDVDLFQRKGIYEELKNKDVVNFMLTSYARGVTWDDSIVVIDEVQNCTAHELDTIITRLGEGSKLYICGDYAQTDFQKQADKDVERVLNVLQQMPHDFSYHEFSTDDIVRSGLVKRYLQKKEAILLNNK